MLQQDHEHVEQTEGRRRHDEEVNGGKVGDLVLEERSPSLRGWLPAAWRETRNGPLINVEPQLELFAVNAGAPQRGLASAMVRTSSASSERTGGRPVRPRRAFHVQKVRNSCRCQRIAVSGRTTWSASHPGLPLGKPYPERAIEAPEPAAASSDGGARRVVAGTPGSQARDRGGFRTEHARFPR